MKHFTIQTPSPYKVFIGYDIIKDTGKLLSDLYSPRKVCIITDNNVSGIYSEAVENSLSQSGFYTTKIIFPAGEHSKNLTIYSNILEALADDGYTRSDMILALGGGVVCDIAGFAAATYMRGIKYVSLPTDLQASVDAAVGGKTGLNLKNGKNLVGAFWQPSLVICDYMTFETLPAERMLDGIAEAVKTAVISESGLIDYIKNNNYQYVLDRCISLKKSLVEADEHDTGLRQLLNFGHTIGHGIEKLTSYSVTHGRAVAKGMIAESKAAYRMGLTSTDISGELTDILDSLGFDTTLNYNPAEISRLAMTDKKIKDGMITLIVPDYLGKCTLRKLSLAELEEFISAGLFA